LKKSKLVRYIRSKGIEATKVFQFLIRIGRLGFKRKTKDSYLFSEASAVLLGLFLFLANYLKDQAMFVMAGPFLFVACFFKSIYTYTNFFVKPNHCLGHLISRDK